ncbi:alcohol dehydrogenase [Amylostereum chailletii]|nr:alcohol dehydrogenase [Amylostereum chailletii]
MAPVRNGRHTFAEIPTDAGLIAPGKHLKYDDSQTIDLDNVPLGGGFLIKTLVLSVDPYMRWRMREAHIPSYSPAFEIGKPLNGHGVGVVTRSETPDMQPGDHLYGPGFLHQEYFVAKDPKEYERIVNEIGVPWSLYVGVLGMPGQTAWFAWKEFSKVKKGQTVFISAVAGAVGNVVAQLAKLDGMKVIGSTGSDEKVMYARSLGVDVAFNYKKESTEEILKREGPIDIYWDNVGGEALDLALKYASDGAQFIECGLTSIYNNESQAYPYQNMFSIVANQISIHGFRVGALASKWAELYYREVPRLLKDGKLKPEEDRSYGLENVGEAFLQISTGDNKGKKVVIVAED